MVGAGFTGGGAGVATFATIALLAATGRASIGWVARAAVWTPISAGIVVATFATSLVLRAAVLTTSKFGEAIGWLA